MPWTRANLPLPAPPHPQESISSSGTPHKRDSFIYSTWLEDSVSTTSGGSSPGTRPGAASSGTPAVGGGQGRAQSAEPTSHAPGGGAVTWEAAGGSLPDLRRSGGLERWWLLERSWRMTGR